MENEKIGGPKTGLIVPCPLQYINKKKNAVPLNNSIVKNI